MVNYYRERNLIVRTDSFENDTYNIEKNVNKIVKKKEINDELWKKKVKKDKNNISKLTKNNFPKLR
jgi:hypothetical protein